MKEKDIPRLYVGYSNFDHYTEEVCSYVDKTQFLNYLFSDSCDIQNLVFIRPRRIGKTLNMSMIANFCELNYQNPGDTSYQQRLFIDNPNHLAIANAEYKDLRDRVMGQLPIIYVSFAGIYDNDFNDAITMFLNQLDSLYSRFLFILDSNKISAEEKDHFNEIYNLFYNLFPIVTNKDELIPKAQTYCVEFIQFLGKLLYKAYGRQVLVIIDEYDVLLQKSVLAKNPYYEQMLSLVRDLSVNSFKKDENPWLYKGIITCSASIDYQEEINKECDFTIFEINDEPFTSFFGFTQQETENFLSKFNLIHKIDEFKEYYGGYIFGTDYIYNVWAVIQHCLRLINHKDSTPDSYLSFSSISGEIIGNFIKQLIDSQDRISIDKLQHLLDGKSVKIKIVKFDKAPSYKDKYCFDSFASFLLDRGYLTFDNSFDGIISTEPGKDVYVQIPNLDIRSVYVRNIRRTLSERECEDNWYNICTDICNSLSSNDINRAQSIINHALSIYISIYVKESEDYYSRFVQCILNNARSRGKVYIKDQKTINKDLDSGNMLFRYSSNDKVVILEFKRSEENCLKAAQEASVLLQYRQYYDDLFNYNDYVYGIGLGFSHKRCEVISIGNMAKINKKI